MSEKGQGVRGALEAGREAMRQHDWEEARRLLSQADGEGSLDGEGLRLLGKACDWCGDPTGSRDAFERSYAAFVAAGDRRGEARAHAASPVEEVDHAGDGFFVAFPDAVSALDCAITIQRRLADHRRDHGFAPKVRMGVHATTASRAGGSYRGRGVHEASRVALAGPDEIVASRRTVPAGMAMSRPRNVTVKGISEPLEVVTVEWTR